MWLFWFSNYRTSTFSNKTSRRPILRLLCSILGPPLIVVFNGVQFPSVIVTSHEISKFLIISGESRLLLKYI